jgi:capsular exopolysaccharide synthesis family protein
MPGSDPMSPSGDGSLLAALWRQKWIVVGLLAVALGAAQLYLVVTRKVYTAKAVLQIERLNPSLVTRTSEDRGGGIEDRFLATQAELLRGTSTLAMAASMPGADDMEIFQGVSNRVNYLKRSIEVEVSKDKDLVEVSLASPYGDDAVKVVSAVVEAYKAYQSDEKRNAAARLLDVQESERNKLKEELAKINLATAELRQANESYGLTPDGGSIVMQRVKSVSDALTAAQLETLNARAAFEDQARAMGFEPADAEKFDDGRTAPMTVEAQRDLRSKISELQASIDDLSVNFGRGHPSLLRLEGRLRQLRLQQLNASLSSWKSAQRREAELKQSFAGLQQDAAKASAALAQKRQLESDYRRVETQLDVVQARISELSVAREAGALSIKLVDEPSTDYVAPAPRASRVLALAGLVGLALGVAGAMLREHIDPRLRGVEDAATALHLPVLGTVPNGGRQPAAMLAWASHLGSGSRLAESIRVVRTSLQFGFPKARTVAVVSPASGEGKTVVAANLAISIAQSGRSVLLIDTNFKSPSLHALFDLPPTGGLAGVIDGNLPVERAVRSTAVEHLSVLSAGHMRMAGAELLNSQAFADLLDQLNKQFDVIVFDTSAVAVGSDSRIVAAFCDVSVLVVRLGQTNKITAQRSRDGLINVGATIAGMIVNDLNDGSGGADLTRMFESAQSTPRNPKSGRDTAMDTVDDDVTPASPKMA